MPRLTELFTVFAGIALVGFGGVLVWARRTLVDQRRWMTAEEFNNSFALCQVLPGPNIVNMAVVFGGRVRGPLGALAAALGLMGPPVAVVLIVAWVYGRYGDLATVQRALTGISAVGVGLFAATVIKMAMPLARRVIVERRYDIAFVAGAVFVAVALARVSMPLVLALAIPCYIAVLWWWRRA